MQMQWHRGAASAAAAAGLPDWFIKVFSVVGSTIVAFGIACVLPSYSFVLILSDLARAALGR